MYALPVAVVTPARGNGLLKLLPGALEGNSATLAHPPLTVLLARNPRSFRLPPASVVLHSAINLAARVAMLPLRGVWLVELVIAVLALALFAAMVSPERGMERVGS